MSRRWSYPGLPRLALGLVVAAFAVLATSVAVLNPPWEGTDEPDHVGNVETLAAGHLYRMRKDVNPLQTGPGDEAFQPPAYYALVAGWQRLLSIAPFTPRPVRAGCNPIADPRCRYYRHDTRSDSADQRRESALRLPSVLFATLAVLLTALAARRISDDPWTPVVAAATVAFVPRFATLSGQVSNDNLADLLGAVAAVVGVTAVTSRAERSRRRAMAVALGAVLGAVVLTKLTALPVAAGLLLAAYLSGDDRRERAGLVGIAVGVALVVSSPWLIRNVVSYGDPLALGATHDYLKRLQPMAFAVGPLPEALFVTMPRNVYRYFWHQSGHPFAEWRWWVVLPFWALTAAALAGLARRAGGPASTAGRGGRPDLALLAVLAVAPFVFVLLDGLEVAGGAVRYAYVGLPALGCLIALGLERHRAPVVLRFALPLLGLVATIIAIRQDIVGYAGA